MFTCRAIGVFLISGQRYLTVCRSHGTINYKLSHCHPVLLGFGHWLLAFSIYLPALLNTDTRFENEITLLTIASRTFLQYTSITVMSTFLVTGISIIYMYSMILKVMLKARKVHESSSTVRKSGKKMQDARLTLHAFVLVVLCFISFAYYIGEYILAFDEDVSRVRAFRLYFPTVSGNFSFINPIMLLLLNKDVQNRIHRAFCCFHGKSQSSLVIRTQAKSTGATSYN